MHTLPIEIIAPCQIIIGKNRTEIDILANVCRYQIAVAVYLHISVLIVFEIRSCIQVTQRTTLLDNVFRLTKTLDLQTVFQWFVGKRIGQTIHQFGDFVFIPREREVRIPRKTAPRMAVTQTCFNTRVADIARLNVHARIARRGGHRRLERLIIRVGPIPRSGQSQVVPQSGVNTDFPCFGTLRVKLLDRTERRRQPLLVRFVVRIGRSGQEPREGDAHGRKGCSQLEVSKCFRHIESYCRQPGETY